MKKQEYERMDADDIYYAEDADNADHADETWRERRTYREHRSGRRRRWHSFAAVITGAVIGALLCACVFAITAVHNTSTAAETDLDYHDKVDLILNYLRAYYLKELDD